MSKQKSANDPSLSVEALILEAKEAEQLDDFGDNFFLEPLGILVESLNVEANLNAEGHLLHHGRILNSLRNRLRMEDYIRGHPEILEADLMPPAVIVGLTRTGSTMLHRILSSDSRFFAPLWYEVRNPSPYLDWTRSGVDQRVTEAKQEIAAMLEANPELDSIHPMDPLAADEEVLLLEQSFFSTVPGAFAHVPSYNAYVNENDPGPTYQYLKRQLLFLQWQKQQKGEHASRWLLKAPAHLLFMDALLDVFPGIQVISTHRDPLVTIPSTASFYYNLYILGSDRVDKEQVAKTVLDTFALGIQSTLDCRERRESQFFDAWYEDTVARPFEVIEQLYAFLKMQFTREAREAMAKHRDEHKREERPAHSYTLDEYAFTEAGINSRFADYKRRFIS